MKITKMKSIKDIIKYKQSQEEMVGFVVIVVLVSIIAVIFLVISLKSSKTEVSTSKNIDSLISSLSQLTTECEIPASEFKDIGGLIDSCDKGLVCDVCNGNSCNDTKDSCKVLENTLKKAIEASYAVTEESYVSYYNLTLYNNFDKNLLIKSIIKGSETCLGKKAFNEIAFDEIRLYLEVCFRSE